MRKKRMPGYCIECGWRWPEPGKCRCPECCEKRKLAVRHKKEELKEDKRIYSLEKVNKMAIERGLSYGQMVALMEAKG